MAAIGTYLGNTRSRNLEGHHLHLLFSFYNESAQISSSIALAALRLGNKYAFTRIQKEALRRISLCYAKNVEDCHLRPLDCDDTGACPVLWEYSDDCLDVFRLARQFNLDNLVVAALYRCSNDISVDDIFGAVSSRTGPSALRLPELLDCMKARELLVKANSRTLEFLTSWDGSADCLSRTADQDSRCPIAVRAMSSACSFIADITSPSSLFSLEDWFCRQAEAVPAHICWPCVWDLCGKDNTRRKAIWNEMQQAFCPVLVSNEVILLSFALPTHLIRSPSIQSLRSRRRILLRKL